VPLGFTNFDAYLDALTGKDRGQRAERFRAVPTKQGERVDIGTVPRLSQDERAEENGVSVRTQRMLDRLARDAPTFETWAELEATYHFVSNAKPELFGKTFAEARAAASKALVETEPPQPTLSEAMKGNQNATKAVEGEEKNSGDNVTAVFQDEPDRGNSVASVSIALRILCVQLSRWKRRPMTLANVVLYTSKAATPMRTDAGNPKYASRM
jgi:hypothetical protein